MTVRAAGVLAMVALAVPSSSRADDWTAPGLAPLPTTAVGFVVDAALVEGTPGFSSRALAGTAHVRLASAGWVLAISLGAVTWRERDTRRGVEINDGTGRAGARVDVARWWSPRPGRWRPVVRLQLLEATDVWRAPSALDVDLAQQPHHDAFPTIRIAGGARSVTADWIAQLEVGGELTFHTEPHTPRPFAYAWLGASLAWRVTPTTALGLVAHARAALAPSGASEDNLGTSVGLGAQQRFGPGRLQLAALVRIDQLDAAPLALTIGYEVARR
ncbi:MAG: hypothetical protein IPL61_02200 [Myxococcales bacterium]|nr:hypothetical protein [Myxococcales bacterium]